METMGLTIDKILVILVIAMVLLGPERLPGYAKKLGELTRNIKRMADGAKDRLRDEMGPEFDEVDWKQLDPRQYDPRRIIRDALVEDQRSAHTEASLSGTSDAAGSAADATAAAWRVRAAVQRAEPGAAVNFDEEAT